MTAAWFTDFIFLGGVAWTGKGLAKSDRAELAIPHATEDSLHALTGGEMGGRFECRLGGWGGGGGGGGGAFGFVEVFRIG